MVSTYMFKRVRNLVKLKKSDRAIALELGIDRKTVAKYRESNAPPQYKKRVRESRGDPLEDHIETIRAMLKLVDDLPAADIFLTLKDEHGYQGCLRTVQRRVGEIRDEQPKARFFEQEYSLAEHYGKRRNMFSCAPACQFFPASAHYLLSIMPLELPKPLDETRRHFPRLRCVPRAGPRLL